MAQMLVKHGSKISCFSQKSKRLREHLGTKRSEEFQEYKVPLPGRVPGKEMTHAKMLCCAANLIEMNHNAHDML